MKNFSKLIIPFVVLALSSCTTTNIAVLGSYNYNESSRYVELTENYDFSSKEISSFSIDYISGYINITQEGDEFKMYEKQLDSKKFFPCYYLVENNSVDIKFVKNGTTNEEMKYLQKEIYITIPTSFSSIDIDVVSTFINASNIEIENLNIDSVGGDTTISKIKFNKSCSQYSHFRCNKFSIFGISAILLSKTLKSIFKQFMNIVPAFM